MKVRHEAVVALALLCASSQAKSTDGLGRLFTSETERASLEDTRKLPAPPPAVPLAEAARAVSFEGLILRRGLPLLAWVNGRSASLAQGTTDAQVGASVEPQGLWLRHSRKHLKVGQTGVAREH